MLGIWTGNRNTTWPVSKQHVRYHLQNLTPVFLLTCWKNCCVFVFCFFLLILTFLSTLDNVVNSLCQTIIIFFKLELCKSSKFLVECNLSLHIRNQMKNYDTQNSCQNILQNVFILYFRWLSGLHLLNICSWNHTLHLKLVMLIHCNYILTLSCLPHSSHFHNCQLPRGHLTFSTILLRSYSWITDLRPK